MAANDRYIHEPLTLVDPAYRVLDVAALAGGLGFAAWYLSLNLADPMFFTGAITEAGILFLVAGEMVGLYRSWRGDSVEREIYSWLLNWAITLPLFVVLALLTGFASILDRSLIAVWFISAAGFALFARVAARASQEALRANGWFTQRYAIAGVNELGFQLARNIQEAPGTGLQLIGFYDDRPEERHGDVPEDVGAKLGNLDQLLEQARNREVDAVYVTFPMRAEDRIREVLERLSDTTVSVYVVPDFFVFQLLHSQWAHIGGLPAVSVFENPLGGVNGLVKRGFDLIAASLILLILSIPMSIVALAIWCTSPGPIFFRQKRYGLNGEEILVWKFRSMTVCEDGPSVKQATQGDSRVTPLGAFLRKSSIDELPQLFNVIEGTMSLVGPRPHATAHNEEYRHKVAGYMLRHKVLPGITGLAQVNGWRGETDTLEKMERRVECDHEYIRQWSLWLDIQILFRTIFVVFSSKNAY